MKFIIITVVVLIIIAIVFLAYFGGFKKLTISIAKVGRETLVYESINGNYKQSGQVMDKIYYSLLNNEKIKTFLGFGTYYDNPKEVEESKLRSEAGCVLNIADSSIIDQLKRSYKIKILEEKKYMVTEFPYKGKISVFFSIMKVYPALQKYAKENNLQEDSPVTEIYDIPNKRILYRKEIIK